MANAFGVQASCTPYDADRLGRERQGKEVASRHRVPSPSRHADVDADEHPMGAVVDVDGDDSELSLLLEEDTGVG